MVIVAGREVKGMKDISENIQGTSFVDQVRKEIRLHLQNGEKIDIYLWDAKMVDMGNGHLFLFGKVFDQSKRSYPSDENTSEKLLPWNL
jgi:hypothetical protein